MRNLKLFIVLVSIIHFQYQELTKKDQLCPTYTYETEEEQEENENEELAA